MITLNEIRKDLMDIRYYYSRQELFNDAKNTIGTSTFVEKVEKYNEISRQAPPRLFDLYVSLYLNNNTQESLAERLGYSLEYISRLNRKLVLFFQKQLNKDTN